VRRLRGAVDRARRLVVGSGASGPPDPSGVDESADERDPARSRDVGKPPALRLLAASLLHAQSGYSTRHRIRDDRWCDSRLSHPQQHELHHQRCAVGTVVRRYRRRGGAATAQRLAAARVDLVRHGRPRRQVRLRRRLLRADPVQQNQQRAPGVPLRHAGSDLLQRRESGGVPVRQHEPLYPAIRTIRRFDRYPRESKSIRARPRSTTGWPTAVSTRRISGR
jgi:hypothetical protein